MNDLVKRLRDYGGQSYGECTDTWLAADEIERLNTECEQWVRRYDTAMVERQMYRETAEAAQGEIGHLRVELASERNHVAGLRAEVARLREALQDIFDYECQFSSTSLIACTAKDALAGEEKK